VKLMPSALLAVVVLFTTTHKTDGEGFGSPLFYKEGK
jgi:hypothetical protein